MYTKNDQVAGSWHVNTAQGGVSVPLGVGNAMASYAYSRDSGGLDQTRQTRPSATTIRCPSARTSTPRT